MHRASWRDHAIAWWNRPGVTHLCIILHTFISAASVSIEVHETNKRSVASFELEDYTARVVASELDLPAEAAAQDAQAILARTYVLTHRSSHPQGRLCNRAHCQRMRVKPKTAALQMGQGAATRTHGQVLVDMEGHLNEPTYFADCGGRTADPRTVFGSSQSSARSVDDVEHLHHSYEFAISRAQMVQAFAPDVVFTYASDGRLARANSPSLHESISGDMFIQRLDRSLGGGKVLSNLIRFSATHSGWTAQGRGRGHGVGLCQLGAIELAKRGRSAVQILQHYFPAGRIQSLKGMGEDQ
jgi:stage II sporulation protein D